MTFCLLPIASPLTTKTTSSTKISLAASPSTGTMTTNTLAIGQGRPSYKEIAGGGVCAPGAWCQFGLHPLLIVGIWRARFAMWIRMAIRRSCLDRGTRSEDKLVLRCWLCVLLLTAECIRSEYCIMLSNYALFSLHFEMLLLTLTIIFVILQDATKQKVSWR